MLSASSKESFGYPEFHQRALPGPCLWSHCNYRALSLPHPTHVSTGAKTHQPASPRACYSAGLAGVLAQSGQRQELRAWPVKEASHRVTTVQGHQDCSELQAGPSDGGFQQSSEEKAKEGVASPEKTAESPGYCLEWIWGPEHSLFGGKWSMQTLGHV